MKNYMHPVFQRLNSIVLLFFFLFHFIPGGTLLAQTRLSEPSQDCIDCHESIHPGIVQDWLKSRHAQVTPAEALKRPVLERRMSASTIPQKLQHTVVGCFECHGVNADKHPDTVEHFGYQIHPVVTPPDCQTCHPVETKEYEHSKKAYAVDNLRKNKIYKLLVDTVLEIPGLSRAQDKSIPDHVRNTACFACHGSEVQVKGFRTRKTDVGEVVLPILTNWPNQGVGRINPDGSRGACTACHPRHSFSIEIARQPYTCSQCHLQPDVPAWDVYRESKHGNIFQSTGMNWNWSNVPWRVGKDFSAPTCAVCHNALLTTPDGEILVNRTHDFGARLWVRIFGLIYSHPQPESGATYLLKNPDGLPLPVTFDGTYAQKGLISKDEQRKRQQTMARVCSACHSSTWVENFFRQMDDVILATDKMVRAATQLIQDAWSKGRLDPSHPFDEYPEFLWAQQWLFYANSVRYAVAMAGPDYAAFKNGWWYLQQNLRHLKEKLQTYKDR